MRPALSFAAGGLLALGALACAGRSDDPIVGLLRSNLKQGDRLILARVLDAQGTHVAAVVDTKAGKPELRFYEQTRPGSFRMTQTAQQGDSFKNLSVEDLDGDGKDEIVSTWEGGHLEIIEVFAQGPGSGYRSIFQNAGRQVEKRYDPAGRVEYWITSRTYEEGPGEPPAYATTVYHLADGKYVETPRK